MIKNDAFSKLHIDYEKGFSDLILPLNRINDAKISAGFCTKGICTLDYHGKQPVSRNSIMVKSDCENPAFTFSSKHELEIKNYKAASWACTFDLHEHDTLNSRVNAVVFNKSLFLELTREKTSSLSITFDETSLYSNVHGDMKWQREDRDNNSGSIFNRTLCYTGTNKYSLRDWIENKGAYLIPVKDHERIFETDGITDVNNLDELPKVRQSILDSDELFIDSKIYMKIESYPVYEVECKKDAATIIFNSDFDAKKIYICITFDDLPMEITDDCRFVKDAYLSASDTQEKKYDKMSDNHLLLKTDSHSGTKKMISSVPMYLESAKQPESHMTRASASSYYFVWGWDNIATAMEMGIWNDYGGQRNIISFLLKNTWKDNSVAHRFDRKYSIIQTMHFCSIDAILITLAYQNITDTGDYGYLDMIYPDLKKIWSGLVNKADEKGYIKGPGFYPDNLKAIGRKESSKTAMETGTFYGACRIMEQCAYLQKDNKTGVLARKLHNLIEKNYLSDFYVYPPGALVDCIYEQGGSNMTFPLYAYMGMYNVFGYTLLKDRLQEIAGYIHKNHFIESGIRVTAENDKYQNTESVHHSWYPYWDIYALKLMREGFFISKDRQKSSDALIHYMNLLDKMWDKFHAAMEIVDVSSDVSKRQWTKYGQPWNLNCACGITRAVRESVCGVICDFGTLSVFADGCSPFGIGNVHIKKGRWEIENIGEDLCSYIEVDGSRLFYTCTVPDVFMTKGKHTLKVYNKSERYGFKIYRIIGGRITEYNESDSHVSFKVISHATVDLVIVSDQNFNIAIDGKQVRAEQLYDMLYIIRFTGSVSITINL